MLEQLLNHIQRHRLCESKDKILLAVSGGIDSMVMLHLFRQAGVHIGVAHCNFQLRGAESAADESLVKKICDEYGVICHTQKFDAGEYAQLKQLSIQMAARNLRYGYFQELAAAHRYQLIATAHHLNDSFETVMINLVRGTGLEGVTGIPLKNGNVIRPMLFATRQMITTYAQQHELVWREDKSNQQDDYQRNFIRSHVVTALKQLNAALEETFRNTQERLQGADQLLKHFVAQFSNDAVLKQGGEMRINFRMIRSLPAPAVLLWQMLKDKGYNYTQCQEMLVDHQAGKRFYSSSYVLTIDRQFFIVEPLRNYPVFSLAIASAEANIQTDMGTLILQRVDADNFEIEKNNQRAQLDLSKIKWPLLWRSWKAGDSFVPLGMKHSKKISDFLIDLKIPFPEKERVTVIESAGTVVWVVGYRIHDHFKMTGHTREALMIDFHKPSG